MNYQSISLIGSALFLSTLSVNGQKKNTQPNILFIPCDDTGCGDLGCYSQLSTRTPHINAVTGEGICSTQAYAGSPVSALSRISFMTGQRPGHCEVQGSKEYWKNAPIVECGQNREYSVAGRRPYDPNHVIPPEAVRDNGYTIGMFGKWAGGYEGSCSTPGKRGIDEYRGYIYQFQAHLYYPNSLSRYSKALGGTGVVRVVMGEDIQYPMYDPDYLKRPQYSTDMIYQRALGWLDQQDGKQPLLDVLTYTLPHAELIRPKDSILNEYKARPNPGKKFKGSEDSRYNAIARTRAQFARVIARLDYYVDEVLKKLKEKGLNENTLIVFSSDNGPHGEGGVNPTFFGRDRKLRGLKRQYREGGIRIPSTACQPGHIPTGEVNDHICALYDLMPTLCEVIGIKDYEKKYHNREGEADHFDEISFAPTLLGKNKQKEHDFLYWEFGETDQIAAHMDDWKMVVKKGIPFLYSLKTDIHKDHDTTSQHPGVVKKAKATTFEQHTPNPHFSVALSKR